MNYQQKYELWLEHATDKQIAQQLRQMNEHEIEEAFSGELSFGTAGMRGIMSAGSARMNIYTVHRATEGLAKYMSHHGMTKCAITYDSRNNSQLFAHITAATLANHGITVYITRECMPTPYLSYIVRQLHCNTGVNLTASHNPAEYNGYKVYDGNGCQLLDDDANELTSFINGVGLFDQPLPTFGDDNPLIVYTDDELEQRYINRVLQERLTSDNLDNISVVYTPLNGTGHRIVPETFRRTNLNNIHIVEEQSVPDGNFPTCPYPNPEKAEALTLAKELALKVGADVIVANDPDCDRLGIAVKDGATYRQLGGNEVGILLTDYILGNLHDQGKLPAHPVVVKTIVTSTMVDAIAIAHGVKVENVLTGFKYIGNVIAKMERNGSVDNYLFGFEESCGYLKGSYVRDKDGVVAALLVAECASQLKRQGTSLAQRLQRLYDIYGRYIHDTVSYRFDGISGEKRKNQLLANLREEPLTQLGGSKVIAQCDFLTQTQYDLPRSNVLRFISEEGSQLIVRPSGTEPLIKCYLTVIDDSSGNRIDEIRQQTDRLFGNK